MLTKNIFLTRLFSYFHDLSTNQLGFIPDVMSILESYDLTDHLWTFLDDGFFPENPSWRKIVRDKVTASHVSQRRTRMSHDRDFTLFTAFYINSNPPSIWKIPENYREIELCKFICKLCTTTRLNGDLYTCILCNNSFFNVFQHSSCSCLSTAMIR